MEGRLDLVFSALADPIRRAILGRLATGEATVTELAEPFAVTQPAISKHLKVLERAGLVSRSRVAQTRPCRLDPAPLQELSDWVGMYRVLWDSSFDQLAAFLESTDAAAPQEPRRVVKSPHGNTSKKGTRHVRRK